MHMFAQMNINKTDLVGSFEEIGWFDPNLDPKAAQTKTLQWLKGINFARNLYPDHTMQHSTVPMLIFVPEKQLLRKLIDSATRVTSIGEFR